MPHVALLSMAVVHHIKLARCIRLVHRVFCQRVMVSQSCIIVLCKGLQFLYVHVIVSGQVSSGCATVQQQLSSCLHTASIPR